jgi:hypothetical protein
MNVCGGGGGSPGKNKTAVLPPSARGNDDMILQAAGISSFRRECVAVPGQQIASQHFSYYASARVFIFAAVKGAGMRFSLFISVGTITLWELACRTTFAAGGKRGQLHTVTIEHSHRRLWPKKADSENLHIFVLLFWCNCCRSVGNFSFLNGV